MPPAGETAHVRMETLDESIRTVLSRTKPLPFGRGRRLPLYVWSIMGKLRGLEDSQAEAVLKALDERGIAYCVNWDPHEKEESLREALRIGAMQQRLGLRVNVHASACLYSFFNGDPDTFHIDADGNRFFDSSFGNRKMGCPFALKGRYPEIAGRIEYFLKGYRRQGLEIDVVFADWEIDGPIEWNQAWENSKRCVRCRENIPEIEHFRAFQRAIRTIRSEMQRVTYARNVLSCYPHALVGNYAVYPHDGWRYWYDYFERPIGPEIPHRKDQKARYRPWFAEFEPSGYTLAMPVVYTWYQIFNWYDFEPVDYRWFYNMLLVASNAGQHASLDVPLLTFVHWHTTVPPKDPSKSVRQFTAEKYQELLWHMLLRGHDGFFLWCMPEELGEEIELLHAVWSAAQEYGEFLDRGEPVTFDVPSRPATVISGLRLGDKVLVRRTDFLPSNHPVEVVCGQRRLTVPAITGKCMIIDLD